MNNDIKKNRDLIDSVLNKKDLTEDSSIINEKNIFSALGDKYRKLQNEIRKEKAANLKKGEYITPEAFRFVGKWIEQAGDNSKYSYDMTLYPGDEQEFIRDLQREGFVYESNSHGNNAVFSAKMIADENTLNTFNGGGSERMLNHPTLLGAVIVVVDKNNDVWISVKAIKNLDTGENMNDEYVLLRA